MSVLGFDVKICMIIVTLLVGISIYFLSLGSLNKRENLENENDKFKVNRLPSTIRFLFRKELLSRNICIMNWICISHRIWIIKPGFNYCYSQVQHADFRGQAVLSTSVFVEVWSGLHCHILAVSCSAFIFVLLHLSHYQKVSGFCCWLLKITFK